MKYRMDVEFGKVKKPKPDYKWEKRTYGFKTEQELKSYRMGIEASSYVYDFDIKVRVVDDNVNNTIEKVDVSASLF